MQVSIKNIDEQIFREFKADAVREGISIGKALTLSMEFWLQRKNKEPKMSILHLKSKSWGDESKRVSEEIDTILY